MGLYDWVNVKCKCPNCNKMKVREFQTKDLGCNFCEYAFGDEVDEKYIEFIDICPKCNCIIEAWGVIKNNILIGIKVFGFKIQLNKTKIIKKCYNWDKELKKYVKNLK